MKRKSENKQTKTCADCIHERACKIWTDGRSLCSSDVQLCPSRETIRDSVAYFAGRWEAQEDIAVGKTAIDKNAQVIYTPLKAGRDIYRIIGEKIVYLDVNRVEIYKDAIAFVDDLDNYFTEKDIGKTVFLTREEAEEELEERRNK